MKPAASSFGVLKVQKTVSIIIPAFNEEGNIVAAANSVIRAVSGLVEDYEIILIDDGSTDGTGKMADGLAAKNPKIKAVHNGQNQGFGYSYRRGVELAQKHYLTVFPGDNDMDASILTRLITESSLADVITSYPVNNRDRTFFRRTVSRLFVGLMNGVSRLNLRYYNGAFIAETTLVRSLKLHSNGLTVLAECMVKLIKAGHSYRQIPLKHTGRKAEKSKALTLKNLKQTAVFMLLLVRDIYFPKSPC